MSYKVRVMKSGEYKYVRTVVYYDKKGMRHEKEEGAKTPADLALGRWVEIKKNE